MLSEILFTLLFCFVFPNFALCQTSDEKEAVQLVHNYYQFISSQEDVPNAEYAAGEKFDYPVSDSDGLGFEGPGGDDETYQIVDEDYQVLKVESKKDHSDDKDFGKSDVKIILRFKEVGVLDLFKEGFEVEKGFLDVTFYCSKLKGKYYVSDLDILNIRFYEPTVKYLENKNLKYGISELAGLKRAHEAH